MTAYSVIDVAKIWIRNGGASASDQLINACAVCWAESGGDSTAISPSGDYGLWQINRSAHFGDGTIDSSNWFNPDVNAREAIKLSNNGQNWAAWCTAWANPGPNCGHGNLHDPQPGSPAFKQLNQVEADLAGANLAGGRVGGGGPVHVGNASVTAAWAAVQSYTANGARSQWADINQLQHVLERMS